MTQMCFSEVFCCSSFDAHNFYPAFYLPLQVICVCLCQLEAVIFSDVCLSPLLSECGDRENHKHHLCKQRSCVVKRKRQKQQRKLEEKTHHQATKRYSFKATLNDISTSKALQIEKYFYLLYWYNIHK